MYARQQGMTLFSMLNIMVFVALVLLAMKIIPEYLENRTVKTILQDVTTDQDISSLGGTGIRQAIQKRLEVNNIRLPDGALRYSREGRQWNVDLTYERRVPVVYNMSVVISFSHHYEAVKP
ncbi:DUF4845 domain-containing protein [Pokkaliibacter sp. CJK22405]|uniref:DUF4845 domain-containing protein n=1 Tax=Pokkaliibacter sp. CJK22405 TaxID=3384615 RepID=UPI00398519E2